MNWESQIFILDGTCGLIFLVAFMITYLFPPKKINSIYGYRTTRSMKNQENWDFAQRFSSIQFLKSSVVLILLSIAGIYTNFNQTLDIILACTFLAAAILYPVYKTQKALKEFEAYEKDHTNG